MRISFDALTDVLRASDNVGILTHRRPDGDTLGCAAALCRGLRQLGKTAWLLPNPELTARYVAMTEGLWAPESFQPSFVCAVDVADRQRLCDNAPARIDLAIDHHPSFTDFGEKGYADASMAACGEIIYELLLALGVQIDVPMAEAIYTAVSTDTGCFCYNNTTSHTHRVGAACMDLGADWHEINYRCFRLKTRARVAMEGHLYSTMTACRGGEGAVAVITREDIARVGAAEDDLENLSSLLTQIEGVRIAALLTETPERDGFKVSMRSYAYDVSKVCAVFGGGGHAGAAGCTIKNMDRRQAAAAVAEAMERAHA